MNQLIDFKIVGEYKELYMLGMRWKDLCDQLKESQKKEKLLHLYQNEEKLHRSNSWKDLAVGERKRAAENTVKQDLDYSLGVTHDKQ